MSGSLILKWLLELLPDEDIGAIHSPLHYRQENSDLVTTVLNLALRIRLHHYPPPCPADGDACGTPSDVPPIPLGRVMIAIRVRYCSGASGSAGTFRAAQNASYRSVPAVISPATSCGPYGYPDRRSCAFDPTGRPPIHVAHSQFRRCRSAVDRYAPCRYDLWVSGVWVLPIGGKGAQPWREKNTQWHRLRSWLA